VVSGHGTVARTREESAMFGRLLFSSHYPFHHHDNSSITPQTSFSVVEVTPSSSRMAWICAGLVE
jgi:hypothetical protein